MSDFDFTSMLTAMSSGQMARSTPSSPVSEPFECPCNEHHMKSSPRGIECARNMTKALVNFSCMPLPPVQASVRRQPAVTPSPRHSRKSSGATAAVTPTAATPPLAPTAPPNTLPSRSSSLLGKAHSNAVDAVAAAAAAGELRLLPCSAVDLFVHAKRRQCSSFGTVSFQLPYYELQPSYYWSGNICCTQSSCAPSSLTCPAGPSENDNRKHGSRKPQGRRLPGDLHVEYDTAKLLAGEARPQLEVATVTLYATEAALELRQFVTANSAYICYGLKAGQVSWGTAQVANGMCQVPVKRAG